MYYYNYYAGLLSTVVHQKALKVRPVLIIRTTWQDANVGDMQSSSHSPPISPSPLFYPSLFPLPSLLHHSALPPTSLCLPSYIPPSVLPHPSLCPPTSLPLSSYIPLSLLPHPSLHASLPLPSAIPPSFILSPSCVTPAIPSPLPSSAGFRVAVQDKSFDYNQSPFYGIPAVIAVNMIMAGAAGGTLAILIAVWAQV